MKQPEKVLDTYSLLKRSYSVFRVSHNGSRIYYTLTNDVPTFYISLTTLIRATVPKGESLIKWIAETGWKESRAWMNERADYGTLMHYLIGVFILEKKYDFAATSKICEDFCLFKSMIWKEEWAEDLNSDLAAFMQFVIDYKVEPLAVELVLVSDDGYGTAIDLVCNMTVEEKGFFGEVYAKGGKNNAQGSPKESTREKRICALMNFKSRRNGTFYEEEEIQVEFEKRLFEKNFPDIKIDGIYNFSPKEWRGQTPTYSLKDQSDSLNKDKADALLAIAKIELMKRLPKFTTVEGSVSFGRMPTIKTISLEEYVVEQWKQQQEKENPVSEEQLLK